MTSSLIEAIERLHISDNGSSSTIKTESIDDFLFEQVVPREGRKRPEHAAELETPLEKKYLTPPTTFSTEWLNRLQQYVQPSTTQDLPLSPCISSSTEKSLLPSQSSQCKQRVGRETDQDKSTNLQAMGVSG